VLPEYRRDFYAPYWAALYVMVPVMLVAAPFYIAFVDQRQEEPEDIYAELGAFILNGALPRKSVELRHHILGWIVKGFFLPLMFVYFCGMLASILALAEMPQPLDFMRFHAAATELLFMIDVLIAAIGYVLTLRILDNHVRSVEPTVFGWLVCAACYAPLNTATGSYLSYDAGTDWTTAFDAWPAVKIAWGLAILLCFTVYAWATVSFGLRFSNLTHRGIITNGPYRWTKHPAYIAKNISWWLVSVPFLTAATPGEALRHSLILLGFSAVYVMRAITEERHLARDPDYVACRLFVVEHGAVARIKRLWVGTVALRSFDLSCPPESSCCCTRFPSCLQRVSVRRYRAWFLREDRDGSWRARSRHRRPLHHHW
jgi:protein-S-isoprenylcysteine O-methyltransferase Ste14